MLRGTVAAVSLAVCVLATGCASDRLRPPVGVKPQTMVLEVTGYCNCGKCCSWKRSWFGLGPAVVSAGPDEGRRKEIGVTACGAKAQRGTVAADTSVLPFGTVLYVPGYGYGRVEDRGGAIAGSRLDLWFPTHEAARQWGRKRLKVTVWKAPSRRK